MKRFFTSIIFLLMVLAMGMPVAKGQSDYCLPSHPYQVAAAPISAVVLGDIQNINNGMPLLNIGYSDFTAFSTGLAAATEYTMTLTTEDKFQHNFTAWIDYDHNQVFDPEEQLGTVQIPSSFDNILTRDLSFTVPDWALNGPTRMRVRASVEPFGPWALSNDPCMPFSSNGEAEDYTIIINNGKEKDMAVQRILSPLPGLTKGSEAIEAEFRNLGNASASGFTLNYSVNDGTAHSETFTQTLQPGEAFTHTFSEQYDFSGLDCYDIKVWVEWANDEIPADDTANKSICKTSPVKGGKIWYLHSNINGGIEPLGGPPFFSTTNEVSMNMVFGQNNWEQAYFETAFPAELFSENSCFVFLDGSFDHTEPLEAFLAANQLRIEAWVAAGGKYFVNCSKENGEKFYTDFGFDGVRATFYNVVDAQASFTGHPINFGPFQPSGTDWKGFYFGNAVLVGDDLKEVVHENDDLWEFGDPALHNPMVAEKPWGLGIAMFGTMGPSQFLDPAPQPMNLRANILHYLSDCSHPTSGVSEQWERDGLAVFPNPTQGEVTLRLPSGRKVDGQLSLHNAFGQMIWQQPVKAPAGMLLTLQLPDVPNGVYFLNLQDGQRSLTQRVVVQR